MPRPYLPIVLLWASACGGAEGEPLELQIQTESQALNAAMVAAEIRLHTGLADCAVVLLDRMQRPGAYSASVNLQANAPSGEARLSEIRPSTYTVAVWGLNSLAQPIAFGCAPISIELGVKAKLSVALAELPPR